MSRVCVFDLVGFFTSMSSTLLTLHKSLQFNNLISNLSRSSSFCHCNGVYRVSWNWVHQYSTRRMITRPPLNLLYSLKVRMTIFLRILKVHDKMRSSRFTWMTPLSQWIVSGMVHSLCYRLGTPWVCYSRRKRIQTWNGTGSPGSKLNALPTKPTHVCEFVFSPSL